MGHESLYCRIRSRIQFIRCVAKRFATIMVEMADRLARTIEPDFTGIPESLMAHALETFGDLVKARSWLATPNPALNNAQPLELAHTARGAEQVDEILTRIDYGIFS